MQKLYSDGNLEYLKLINALEKDGMALPTKKDFLAKKAVIEKYKQMPMSEVRARYGRDAAMC